MKNPLLYIARYTYVDRFERSMAVSRMRAQDSARFPLSDIPYRFATS
jgi:hypothetical protein